MIRLHSTGLSDATILSNIFIDCFMPKANGEFVKVYIYLLRMLNRPEETFGLSQMADSLFCTEGDVLRALKYWENEKLVSLSYEETTLTGITLQTPWNEPAAPDVPGVLATVASGKLYPPVFSSENADSLPAYDTDVHAAADSPKPLSERKPLTPDRVKELKQNEEIIQLLYIAEHLSCKCAGRGEKLGVRVCKVRDDACVVLRDVFVVLGNQLFRFKESVRIPTIAAIHQPDAVIYTAPAVVIAVLFYASDLPVVLVDRPMQSAVRPLLAEVAVIAVKMQVLFKVKMQGAVILLHVFLPVSVWFSICFFQTWPRSSFCPRPSRASVRRFYRR